MAEASQAREFLYQPALFGCERPGHTRWIVEPGRPADETSLSRPPFLSAALLTYGAQAGVAVLSLVNVMIVSRALGTEGRGEVVFLTAIGWLTSQLAMFGIQESAVNFAGAEPRLRRALATNCAVFALVLGALAAAVLAVLVAVIPAVGGHSDPTLRWLVFCSQPVLIFQTFVRSLVQADYRFRIMNATWFSAQAMNVVVNALFAALGILSVGTAVVSWLSVQAAATLVSSVYVARRLAGFGRPDLPLARRMLGFGLRSHFGRVMLLGNFRLDQWILGAVAGARQLGLYSVAVAWAEALFLLPTALLIVQRPDLVRADRQEAARAGARVFRAAALLTVGLAAVLAAAAPILCETFFGESFAGASDELRILVAGAVGMVALKQLGNALTAQRKPTLASVGTGVGFLATIVLDVLLIPRHGGDGAAVASTCAYLLGGITVAIVFVRALGARYGDLVPRPADVTAMWGGVRRLARARPRRRLPASVADSGA